MDTKRLRKTADDIKDKTEAFLLSLRCFIFIIFAAVLFNDFSLAPNLIFPLRFKGD